VQPRSETVRVAGGRIAANVWDQGSDLTLVLVHGARGQSEWWSSTIPHLLRFADVVTFDLSGHGHSDHRTTYDWRTWAQEAATVAAGFAAAPVLVGHSLGGLVALSTAALFPGDIRGVITVDTMLRGPIRTHPGRDAGKARPVFASIEEAAAAFRLSPPQPVLDKDYLDYLVHAVLREVDGGWTWRSDPNVRGLFADVDRDDLIHQARCPLGAVTAGQSAISRQAQVEAIQRDIAPDLVHIDIPEAHHHVMIDHAPELAHALESLVDLMLQGSGAIRA